MNLKKIVFEEYDVNHAALVLKLRTAKVTQKDFFQTVVRLYLESHPCLEGFHSYLLENASTLGAAPKKELVTSTMVGQEVLGAYGLSSQDIENIFDILEGVSSEYE